MARIGVADWQPYAELPLGRTNVSRQLHVTAYRRLVASNDWGRPLGGGGVARGGALRRDDGFYYRTVGGEVGGTLGTAGSAVGLRGVSSASSSRRRSWRRSTRWRMR